MAFDVLAATEFTGLVIGIGGSSAVLYKGVSALRRFGHFIDKLAGNGDSEPGILKRLDTLQVQLDGLVHGQQELKAKLDDHLDTEVPAWRTEGEAWGQRLDSQVEDLDQRVTRLESSTDPAVGRTS